MLRENADIIKKHIKTHSERSAEDQAAVTILKTFLRSDGKLNANFAENDKWPNTDGTFEFVSNPNISRQPEQSFVVQIKGTHLYNEKDGIVKYSLKSLAFPAFIYNEVTLDPGILFVVLNPDVRGQERVFWKYISSNFLSSIDFENNSATIIFTLDDEIKNTDESISNFCGKLEYISNHHSFVKKLENRNYSIDEVKKIIMACNQEITESIDRMDIIDVTRDDVSKRILRYLDDLCRATLLLNSINIGFKNPNLRLAWEKGLLRIETKYLCTFLKGLRYIDGRIPDDGQSERLMLKYYDFLWQIRKFLFVNFNMYILDNLEKFPYSIDKLDNEYYEMVANAIKDIEIKPRALCASRFYVQKKTPFFIGKERYYEITLQLAGIYATKYNRITVYSKDNIDSDYSVQIGYMDTSINLWDVNSSIRVVTKWKVSIDPTCLNKLGKALYVPIKLGMNYGEYGSLMDFLTQTGINLLDFIDLETNTFTSLVDKIYSNTNTSYFKDILLKLQSNYSKSSPKYIGRNVIRYLLLNLREDTLESVLPFSDSSKHLCSELKLSSKCLPFEKNPFTSNLAGKKTSTGNQIRDIISVIGNELYNLTLPYILIKSEVKNTGEIYFDLESITTQEKINKFNSSLDSWEQKNGFKIMQDNELIYIDSYERTTIHILQKLLEYSIKGNKGQKELNKNFIKESQISFDDDLKKYALQNIFTDSQIALIYGAAGTGKTKLINLISNLMSSKQKLFLTKTHTTLQNLKRRIDNSGSNAEFISIDSFTKKINLQDYDVIFIDECSIIDNRIMSNFINKISPNTFIVLAGDIYQIESIDFGNWFFYAKDIIKANGANIELLNTWRTEDETLKDLWNEVRTKSPLITEKLAIDGPFSEDIGPNVFNKAEDDEVILCLNYDGKFGLNNMNNYFQNANKTSNAVSWQEWSYKIGDPILFNDSKRFPLLYNNLKGRIVDVIKTDESITFTIDVADILTESDCRKGGIEFIDIVGDTTTRIRFDVHLFDSNADDDIDNKRMSSVIPFQLAYAVSIHKAQGLEYDSVKVIIPSNNSEKITHGIFYTAITRAKKKLKIYWSSETMRDIVGGFSADNSKSKSLEIIKSKL